jgi:hypothetical protein
MAADPHCRIAKVKFKDGGTVLPVQFQTLRGEIAQRLVEYALEMASRGPLAGFVIVGWGHDGEPLSGYSQADDGPIPISMLPAFVTEVVRKRTFREEIREMIDQEYFGHRPSA